MVLHGVSQWRKFVLLATFPDQGAERTGTELFLLLPTGLLSMEAKVTVFPISCLSPTQSLCFRVKHGTFLSRLSFHYNSASRFSDSFPLQINSGSKNVISHYSGRILQLICGSRACWTTFCHTKRAQTLTHTKPFPAYLSSLTLLRTKKKQWN